MGADTKIQWAHHTFNPWRGCIKIAEGCKFCYADAQSRRNPGTLGIWGPDGTRVVASESMWRQPLKWNRPCPRCKGDGCEPDDSDDMTLDPVHWMGPAPCSLCNADRPRVFCASLADWAEDWQGRVRDSQGRDTWVSNRGTRSWDADDGSKDFAFDRRPLTLDDVRVRLFRLIDDTPNLDWLLLTKRPENVLRIWPKMDNHGGFWHKPNVWLGCSVACQEDADRNLPHLIACRDLADKLFVSVEPLVGPVDLGLGIACGSKHNPQCDGGSDCPRLCPIPVYRADVIDWVIVGGESGTNARPCDVEWIESIVGQCQAAGVPVFVKQDFGRRPGMQGRIPDAIWAVKELP